MPTIAIWLAGLLIYIASVGCAFLAGRHDGRKVERAIQQTAMIEAMKQQRADYEGRINEQAGIAEEARKQAEQNSIDRDAAVRSADSLRDAKDAAVRAARKCSAAASASAPAYDAAGMLGRVLQESIERNRQLAAYADAARTSGTACESSYETLRRKGQ